MVPTGLESWLTQCGYPAATEKISSDRWAVTVVEIAVTGATEMTEVT